MWPLRCRTTLGLAIVLGCLCLGQSSGTTGVEGVILIGPASVGPAKAGAPLSVPFAHATFLVEGNGVSQSFTTDNEGRFRIVLNPGHYAVKRPGPKPAIGHFGPFSVEVVKGTMTKVEWECDSGTR